MSQVGTKPVQNCARQTKSNIKAMEKDAMVESMKQQTDPALTVNICDPHHKQIARHSLLAALPSQLNDFLR